MGKPTGFKEYQREGPQYLAPAERVQNFEEFLVQLPNSELVRQGARCMDCGVPFCHAGCPLGNLIPEFNDLIYKDDWLRAYEHLVATNNFPEFTGRVCPAPCEDACVLTLSAPSVTIKNIELAIIDRAFEEGWVKPVRSLRKSGHKVAVVGSGPAGLACAEQLISVGHEVKVIERADQLGGLLRYGIPDFKLQKRIIERRVALLSESGVEFETGVEVGRDVQANDLLAEYSAVVLACGANQPRELLINGKELQGLHYAMEFLAQQNRRVSQQDSAWIENGWWFGSEHKDILATGKDVIVIGGGDTGADCVGTSHRQGARSVTQFQYRPAPPSERPSDQPWPLAPIILRPSSSHEEGGTREYSILASEICGENGKITGLKTVNLDWQVNHYDIVEGSEKFWPADLILVATGFIGSEQLALLPQLGLKLNSKNLLSTSRNYMTDIPGVFACGDMRRGQSLVVWAISEGRETARSVDEFLMGQSDLRAKGVGDLPLVR